MMREVNIAPPVCRAGSLTRPGALSERALQDPVSTRL